MPFCSQCGSAASDEAKFCSSCGTDLTIEAAAVQEVLQGRGPIPLGQEVVAARGVGIGSVRARSALLRGLLGLVAILAVATAISTRVEIEVLERIEASTGSEAEAHANHLRRGALMSVGSLLFVATGITWLMWQHKAHANLRLFGARDLRFTPGWGVGWWFIPFANVVQPVRAVAELHRHSTAGGRGLARVGWWWTFWLAQAALAIAATALAGDAPAVADLITSDYVSVTSDLVNAAGAILAIAVVHDITTGQQARAAERWVTPA